MLLILSSTTYTGRFLDRARNIIASGGTVGYHSVSSSNYVRCDVCPASFAPTTKENCETCKDVKVSSTHRYEFGTIVGVKPIYFCDKHLPTYNRFAGTVHEENYTDIWGECPGCKTVYIFNLE